MAFSISVYRRADRSFLSNPPEVDSPFFGEWEAEAAGRELFTDRLGGDQSVYEYWSRPAQELGLPLLTRLYGHGLDVEGADLEVLRQEVEVLRGYWLETVDPELIDEHHVADLRLRQARLLDLLMRADAISAAIRLAQRADGFVTMS